MKLDKSIIITLIITLAVLIIAIVGFTTLKPNGSENTVTVQGVSQLNVEPDLLTVYFNIETKGETSQEAKTSNDLIYNKLRSELILKDFSEEDLKTQNFNIYPNINWNEGERKEEGYIANHQLKLELEKGSFNLVDEVIDVGVESGSGISYINFELTKELQEEYKIEALKLASQDARTKAEAVAGGFNKKLGKLVSVQTSDFYYYPFRAYSAEAGIMEDAAVVKESVSSINPAEQDVNAQVSAVYSLR